MSDLSNESKAGPVATVLVTGASGFVGRRLAACLRDAGFAVRGALRHAGRPLPEGVEPVVVGEIGPDTDWSAALAGVDAVVHCANLAHVAARDAEALAAARRVNVAGSVALARQAVAAGVGRFVYLSSLLARVAERRGEQGEAEGDPYAATKLEAERQLAGIAGGTATQLAILRPPLIYGAGAGANFARLVAAVEAGWPLPLGAIENRRSFLWIDNLADLVATLLRHPLPVEGLHEPQDPEPLSTPAFCRAIGAALGRPARLLPVPPALLKLAGRLSGQRRIVESLTANLVADDRSLREDLGWTAPLGTAEALQRSLVGRRSRVGAAGAGAAGAIAGRAGGPLWLEALYGALGAVLSAIRPGLRLYLARRVGRGREDPERLAERWGREAVERPEGPLYWLHAASNGELASALPLIEEIARRRPHWRLLVTTGTVTSARLAAERLPAAIHRFVPIDEPRAVDGFFRAWRPDLGLIVESELWPILLRRARRRGVPLALVNGRMSERSFRVWRSLGPVARDLLGCFRLVLAQSRADAERLAALGAPARCLGNLKACAAPLPVDGGELRRLRQATVGRTIWLSASTHPGEEAMVADAHRVISVEQGDLLTILAPRHARRGAAVRRLLEQRGLTVAQRSRGEPIEETTDVYLADTMGELGLLYRLAPLAFIGGSLVPIGGHNPLEAAKLDCAVVSGRHVGSFQETVDSLEAAGGLLLVEDTDALAAAVGGLLADPHRRAHQAEEALKVAERQAAALADIVDALDPLFAEAERR